MCAFIMMIMVTMLYHALQSNCDAVIVVICNGDNGNAG